MTTDNQALKLLFVSSEVEGLLKTGGLADVARCLPDSLTEMGHDVRVAMPLYRSLKTLVTAPCFSGVLNVRTQPQPVEYSVYEITLGQLTVYAIDAPQYFDREAPYAENNQAYSDNGERFTFFNAAVLDCLPHIGFQPQIIHCNDWQAAFIPFLLKTRYENDDFYQSMRSVVTIHNAMFRGDFDYSQFSLIPELIQSHYPQVESGEGTVSMLKAGIMFADRVNAVSVNYARELLTPLGAHGLHDAFSSRGDNFSGILNGCDYGTWNPEIDPLIAQRYKANKVSLSRGKKACKRDLQNELSLPENDVALYGMVCRLTNQKGIQYLLPILQRFLNTDVQLVIVGTGDPQLAQALHEIAANNSDRFRFVEAYDDTLAHKVEAGADFFLMPSEFEPCGLNQIYSLAYGTLPIVRAVGGLVDTVIDYDTAPSVATGFHFESPEPFALLAAMQRSLLLYTQQPAEFRRVQLNAMASRFEWKESAMAYEELYFDIAQVQESHTKKTH